MCYTIYNYTYKYKLQNKHIKWQKKSTFCLWNDDNDIQVYHEWMILFLDPDFGIGLFRVAD